MLINIKNKLKKLYNSLKFSYIYLCINFYYIKYIKTSLIELYNKIGNYHTKTNIVNYLNFLLCPKNKLYLYIFSTCFLIFLTILPLIFFLFLLIIYKYLK
jgi:hypothetical protein